jgi:hypothetical protein
VGYRAIKTAASISKLAEKSPKASSASSISANDPLH